jgi:MATE family multidrug resistance protein
MLSNLTVPLLGLVDTAVVGHLPESHHMGAVAVGAMIFGIVYWGFGFLRMGTTGLTAQAFGAGQGDELRAVLGRALFLALGFALLLLLLQKPIGWLAFNLIHASEAVEQEGQIYFFIRILSAPATLVNYVLLGWFLGMQNARSPLLILTFVNAINMLLDVIFVTGAGMGAGGVAWASVIAEYAGLVLGVMLMRRQLRGHAGTWRRELLFNKSQFLRLLSLNTDIFIRTLCLMLTLAFFTAQGARLGELVLAANAVLFQLHTFIAYCLDGFAHAAEALVGRSVGSRNRQAFSEFVTGTTVSALVVSVVFALLILLSGKGLVGLITDIDAVREVAVRFLPWLVALPLVSVWGFVFDGIYIGAIRAREMRNAMLFSTLLVFMPAWFLLQGFGNHGLWLAFILFMVARGVSMALIFQRLQRHDGFMQKVAAGH